MNEAQCDAPVVYIREVYTCTCLYLYVYVYRYRYRYI